MLVLFCWHVSRELRTAILRGLSTRTLCCSCLDDFLLKLFYGEFFSDIFEYSLHKLRRGHVPRHFGIVKLHCVSRWKIFTSTRSGGIVILHILLPRLLPDCCGLTKLRVLSIWHVLRDLRGDFMCRLRCRLLSTELRALWLHRLFGWNL